MATLSSSSSDFTVVLFNCGARVVGNERVVNEPTRQECVKQVLNRLPLSDDCNLFLLVQDTISGLLHTIISEYASACTGYTAGPHNEEAGVYSFSVRHDVKYLDPKYLVKVFEKMTSPASEHFSVDRLAACVITHESTRDKTLLVSWHGRYKIPPRNKVECLRIVIDFLQLLKDEKECSNVMLCGDFNLSVDYARRILTADRYRLDGVVCDDYQVPHFRARRKKIDYIIRWPERCYNQLERPILIDPHFEAENGDRVENPFNHPIVKFRFTAEETGQREQRIDTLERHQKSRKEEVEELMKRFEEMNLRVNTLERQEEHHKEEVLEKDERITALETELEEWEEHHKEEVLEKDERITDLETELEEREEHHKEEVLEKDERITDLETELEEREEHHKEEVLEKDERITALETELEEWEEHHKEEVLEKDEHIIDLETKLEEWEEHHKEEVIEKDQRITALETKLKKEEKHRRKEDKEKNKVIKTLETKLAEQEEINKRELRKNEEKDQQIEDLMTQIQQLRMDSTNLTTDSSPLPGSEEPEP